MTNQVVREVTARIIERSKVLRGQYLEAMKYQESQGKGRTQLSCGNLAHAVAASCQSEKDQILNFTRSNVGLVSSYNDMLSAHQPYLGYPQEIKVALAEYGHTRKLRVLYQQCVMA